MSHKHDQSKALLEVWEILSRYRWRFVVPAFLAAAAVLCISLWLPRKYKAEGIFERRTDMVFSEITTKGATRPIEDPRGSLSTEIAGPPAVDALLERLEPTLRNRGLVTSDAELQALRTSVLLRTVVHWDVSSSVMDRIRVEYIGTHPELAKLIVNGLIEQYLERTRTRMTSRLETSASFFSQEVARNRKEIEQLENQVLAFELEHSALLPEHPSNVQAKLAEAETSLIELISLRDAAATRVDSLRDALAQTAEMAPTLIKERNPALVDLENKRRDLERQITKYLNEYKMTAQHPDLVAVRQQLAELDQRIAATDIEVVTQKRLAENPKRAELEMRLTTATSDHRALSKQVQSLQQQITQMHAQSNQVFAVRSDYQRLNRRVDEAQRQLAFWEDNLRRVEMALTAEHGDRAIQLDFIQPAHARRRPVSPDIAQVLMATVALALLAGAANVFLAYRTDESYSDGEELAKDCGLPLMGSVSELVTRRHRRLRMLRAAIVVPANALVMAGVLAAIGTVLYLDLEHPDTLERFKRTATALIGQDAAEPAPPATGLSAVDTDTTH